MGSRGYVVCVLCKRANDENIEQNITLWQTLVQPEYKHRALATVSNAFEASNPRPTSFPDKRAFGP